MSKVFNGLGQDFFCITFLVASTLRHYSSDAKEVNILIVVDCFKIGVKLGGGGVTLLYMGKTVWCSFINF